MQPEASEPQEAMLTRSPAHLGRWDRKSYEAVAFNADMRLLAEAVLEGGAEPRIDEAGNVDSSRRDEVVPLPISKDERIMMVVAYQEVSVASQCQKNTITNTTAERKCVALKSS